MSCSGIGIRLNGQSVQSSYVVTYLDLSNDQFLHAKSKSGDGHTAVSKYINGSAHDSNRKIPTIHRIITAPFTSIWYMVNCELNVLEVLAVMNCRR